MDQRMLEYYKQELLHLREMGREFAEEHPKIGRRLDLDSFEKDKLCPDPYVERLLEGFAFLAARVQLKIDAEFPEFTQHLLEFVYPHFLAPLPSMMVARMQPDDACPADGCLVERHTVLYSKLDPVDRGERTRCIYRTAHPVQLLPLEITGAKYLPAAAVAAEFEHIRDGSGAAGRLPLSGFGAAIRLGLKTTGNSPPPFGEIALDTLPLFLSGPGNVTALLYEHLLGNAVEVAVAGRKTAASSGKDRPWLRLTGRKPVPLGFGDNEALLPYGPRSFQGYRLLQEYFAFPERFLFVELAGLRDALKDSADTGIELYILLKQAQPALEGVLNKDLFALFCTPAVNLFPLPRADHIDLAHTQPEYQIIPDRTRTEDFEVYAVESVTGHGTGAEQAFLPFYSINSGFRNQPDGAYYTIQRRKSLPSARKLRHRNPTGYAGTDTYISLVDARQAPYDHATLRELRLKLLCTNRDLPHRRRGRSTEFRVEIDAKAEESIRSIAGPTAPRPSPATGAIAWRLVSHLSLNYLSLANTEDGAAALRELLSLYSDPADDAARRQIEGLQSVSARNVVRRIDAAGPIVFGRGLEITVQFEEAAFEGSSAFLLGAVLERFFARYASLNTFTETVITTDKRGEIMRWPSRIGQRQTL